VYSGREDDSLAVLNCFRVALEGGDNEHIAIIARYGLREGPASESVFAPRVSF
jgi:hypothetical protein